MIDFYKVGGSLRFDHPTYITRQADRDIYHALKQQEFCYVLNSRQMGKSSLRVRTMKTLTQEGFKCVAIDLGILGRFTTAEQWYGGLLAELWRKLSLTKGLDDDLAWWRSHVELPPVARLNRFIEDVLLINCDRNIIVFLDEVDNIIKLDFRDEFLILIRNCYERRVEAKQYHRLTFCLLGVATPSSLRIDKQISPFNIGKAINLTGFNFNESQPLLLGLNNQFQQPKAILQEVLYLTQGQPFLTQKLCSLIVRYGEANITSILELIQRHLIDNWEIQDEPEHLKTIRDRLLSNQDKARLLNLYQRIIKGEKVIIDGSNEQIELRLSGLVKAQQNKLNVSNPIYAAVFDREWIARQLLDISPYQNAIAAWLKSQNRSRLLRGEALAEGQNWAKKHSITPTEREFLRASECMAIEEQIKEKLAQKTELITKRLAQEKQLVRWQRLFILFSLAMVTGFYLKSRQANLSNIATLVQSSEALSASNQKLDALIAAIAAKRKLNKSFRVNQNLTQQVDTALQQVVYQIKEKNRLLGHDDRLYGVAVSNDGKLMATAATDNTLGLWKKDLAGWQLHRVLKHDGWVVDVAIQSPQPPEPTASSFKAAGKEIIIASASRDRTVKLWNQDGKLLQTLKHPQAVTSVAIHHGQIITGSENGKIYLWQSGKLVKTLTGHTAAVEAIAITPDNKIISASEDKKIKIWQSGKLVKTLTGHSSGVRSVAILGNKIISGSRDRTIKIWDIDGTEIATLTGHLAPVYSVAVNPVNNQIVSASGDNTLKIWDSNGTEITTLKGHTNRVWDVAYLANGNIASASWDETVRIWQQNNNLSKTLSGHQDVAIALDYAVMDDGTNLIASTSDDKTVKLWNQAGTLLKTFRGHAAEVYDVAIGKEIMATVGADKTLRIWHRNSDRVKTIEAHNAAIWAVDISPDNEKIVTAGDDNLIKIWDVQGNLLHTLKGHTQKVWDVAISPNNQYLLSASEDGTVKVWDLRGNLIRTLKGHQDAVRTVITDGKQIISAGEDRTIKIWDLQGNLVNTLAKHKHSVKALALSPNQQYLASADDNGKIILWQRSDRIWQATKTIQEQDNSIWSIAFSPDSETLATAGEDAQITLWNINNILQLDPLKYGCNWVQEYLNYIEVEPNNRPLCSDSN